MKSTLRSSLALVTVGAISLAPTAPAFAAVTSRATATQSLGSGSVAVFASSAQSFTNTGVALSIPITGNVAKNFWINNSGSLGLTKFTITVSLPTNSNVNSFRRCDLNVSFVGNNTCASGTVANFALTPGAAKSFSISLPAMGFYSFQIIQNKTGTMTVSTSVSSVDIVKMTTHS